MFSLNVPQDEIAILVCCQFPTIFERAKALKNFLFYKDKFNIYGEKSNKNKLSNQLKNPILPIHTKLEQSLCLDCELFACVASAHSFGWPHRCRDHTGTWRLRGWRLCGFWGCFFWIKQNNKNSKTGDLIGRLLCFENS